MYTYIHILEDQLSQMAEILFSHVVHIYNAIVGPPVVAERVL